MDRGFWNYGLFWQIQQQKAHFAVRLRAGVKMKSIQRLGNNDALMEWTPKLRSKKRCTWAGAGLPRSIRLRVVRYQIAGFQPSAVVTNVLSPKDISRDEWVRMAVGEQRGQVLEAGLYHRRWEIETLFHELKVIQGMEGGLRSRTPRGIEYEIGGHVLLYLLVRWLMVEAAKKHGAQPLQLSFKNALRELDHMRDLLILSPREHVRKVLLPRLMQRIASHLIDVRPGRHYARPADQYKLGKYRKRSKNKLNKT